VDQAHRPRWGLMVIILFGLITLSGCAKLTSSPSDNSTSSAATSGAAKILTKADQQISHHQIKAAINTLSAANTKDTAAKNLLTGLRHYQKAATALNKNQLSQAKSYFNTLANYQLVTDASFTQAKAALTKQYQQVKLANGYYNSARDDMSVHALAAAKTNIDKLDEIAPTHPVIKELQQKTTAMKAAIMNYEASQSTSSGSDSSTVAESDLTSSDSSADTSSTSSSSADETSDTDDSTATSQADHTTSGSERSMTTKQVLSNFRAAAGVTFEQDDQFNVTKETSNYYQIEVMHDSNDENVTNLTDIYRYYPANGSVLKQNINTGEFE